MRGRLTLPKNLPGRHHVVGRKLRGCRDRNRPETGAWARFAADPDKAVIVASPPNSASEKKAASARDTAGPDARRNADCLGRLRTAGCSNGVRRRFLNRARSQLQSLLAFPKRPCQVNGIAINR